VKIPSPSEFRETFNGLIWQEIAETICRGQNIAFDRLTRASGTDNVVFFIDDSLILKIYTPLRNVFERERAGLEFAASKTSLRFPEIHSTGKIEHFDFLIMSRIRGRSMTRTEWLKEKRGKQIALIQQLGTTLKQLHSFEPKEIKVDWPDFFQYQLDTTVERQKNTGATEQWVESLPAYLENNIRLLPQNPKTVFMHGDVHFGNLVLSDDPKHLSIIGVFDLSDSRTGFHEYEFVAPGVLMIQGQGNLQREFFRAYGYPDHSIDEELRTRLMLMTILYETSGLKRYAARLRLEAAEYSLDELERAIWNFI
jgi:aminoglycoside phosphotransferase (APT) family kinase protein